MSNPVMSALDRLPKAPLIACICLAVGCRPANEFPRGYAAAPSGSRSVLAGVFTVEQAERGEQQFVGACSACHSPNEFSGPIFQQVWKGRAVGELYHVISTMMPQTAPGSLSAQQYADIVAYFLGRNGYPVGEVELPADPAILNDLTFQPAG